MGTQGAGWLKAWQTRHGSGFGAVWEPVVVNEQISRMRAAIGRAKALADAAGLSPGQHRLWAAAAADEAKRLGVLNKELTTERAWRSHLGLNELGLDKDAEGARPGVGGGQALPALVLPDRNASGDWSRRELNHHKRDCAG